MGNIRLIDTWWKLIFKFKINKSIGTQTTDQTAAVAYVYTICGYLLKRKRKNKCDVKRLYG